MSLTLHQYPPAFGLPLSASPRCTQVEVYLRLTKREFTTELGWLSNSPDGTLPYVSRPDGSLTAGADAVIALLEEEGPRLDKGLVPSESARFAPLIDLSWSVLYFGCVYSRFTDPGWEQQKPIVQAVVPGALGWLKVSRVRKRLLKECAANGFVRATDTGKPVAALKEVESKLGSNYFLFGNRGPRVADCALWAVLTHVAYTSAPSPGRNALWDNERLIAYIARVADRARITLPDLPNKVAV